MHKRRREGREKKVESKDKWGKREEREETRGRREERKR